MPVYVGQAVNSIGALGAVGGDFLRSAGPLGTQYSEAFAAGFVTSGPGGVVTVLPMTIVGALDDPSIEQSFEESGLASGTSWTDSYREVVSPDNIGATIARAFEGAGGFWGAIKSLASQAASCLH